MGLTLFLPACGADFLWVDTMGREAELVTTTTTIETTTTTGAPAPPPPPKPKPKLPPKPARPVRPKPPAKPPAQPPQATKPVPQPGDSPLTGIGIGGYRTGHPALVVKIDNVGDARPQIGLVEADVVFEEKVEGGFTRFAAVYHSTPSDPVGPIRSARSTDIALLAPLYHPLFSYSGANAAFKKLVRESSMIDVGVENFPGKYFRDNNGGGHRRSGVHNLFSNTSALHGLAAPDAQAPPPLFAYRQDGTRPSEPEARPVSRVTMTWANPSNGKVNTTVAFDWDPGLRGWTRIQNGSLHTDAAGRKVAPANVVVQFVNYKDSGARDSTGAVVPEADVVGNGEGWFLSEGYLVPITWEKRDPDYVTTWRGKDNRYARLVPGRTWVELVEPGRANASDRPADALDNAKPVATPPPDGTAPTPAEEPTTTTTGPPVEETSTTTSTTGPLETTTSTLPDVGSTTSTSLPIDTPTESTTTTAPAAESSGVAAGPASAALIGLLLLFAPAPGDRRRRRDQR